MKKLSTQDDKKRGVNMITLNQEQNITIATRVIVTWENPYSQIKEYQERIRARKEEKCEERLLIRASWELEEDSEKAFLQKVEKGELSELSEKERKVLKAVEQGNLNGGQPGNYELCIDKAREAWRRQIVIKDDFFMPFESPEIKERKECKNKIYIVMYHEAVEWEYNTASIEGVFNTEEAARHWIAAKVKKEHKKKRQTREFIRKGGNTRNLPYEKEYNRSIWEDVWYTVEEKTIS